jgi:putative copper resistance protein D
MALDLPLAQRAATVVLNLAVAVAVGAAATRLWTARLASPWSRLQDRRAHRIGVAALAVAILASVCGLWLAAAAMAEVPVTQAGEDVWTMLTATHLGTAWQIGMAALLVSVAAMAFASPGRRDSGWTLASAAGMAAFLYTRSMVSHASDAGDFSLIMLVDWLHLLLICLWVGEVVVSGLVVLPSLPGEALANRTDCSRYVESLSTSATVALVGIFATGMFNAWYNLGSPRALIGNPYGTTLLIKLALVLGAAMLGGVNRFVIMPRLIAALRTGGPGAAKPARQFALVLRIEAMLLLLVLVMAAILSATSPPAVG